MGDTFIGKTSIVLRFSDDKFVGNKFTTVDIDFKTNYIKVGEDSVKFFLWDIAGQEKYKNATKFYYKDANGVLLIYDICCRECFERTEFRLKELKEINKIDEFYIILVVKKIYLENNRVKSKEEAEKYVSDNNINYSEVSAKTRTGIINLFKKIILFEIYIKIKNKIANIPNNNKNSL